MKRVAAIAVGVLVLLAALALGLSMRGLPHPWSVLVIVVEPPSRAWLEPDGPAPRTPRLDQLGGAGVRLPLAGPRLSAGEWLAEMLGGEAPERSLLSTAAARGWLAIGASQVPVDGALAARFDRFVQGDDPDATVDAVLDGIGELVSGSGRRAMVVAVVQSASPAEQERATARLIDGAAPWLPPAQTLVVVIDRGMRSAVLVAPSRPADLGISGALGPVDVGDAIARWLRLPLE